MIGNKFQIEITHVPTYDSSDENTESFISFEPFLEEFSDNYKSAWETKSVLGRMDDIATFVQTKRTISIAFVVPSSSKQEGIDNYQKSQLLSKFLYPIYKTIQTKKQSATLTDIGVNTGSLNPNVANFYSILKLGTSLEESLNLRDEVSIMSAAPIIKMKFSNLVNGPDGEGLYGYLDGYNFTPSRDSGFYLDQSTEQIIPKEFKISLTFNVIHNYKLGWTIDNQWRGQK